MAEPKYPLNEKEHIVHPKGANIKKKCEFCQTSGKEFYRSSGSNMWLEHVPSQGWHIGASIKLTAASLYSDEDQYVHCKSDAIQFCPKCGRKL